MKDKLLPIQSPDEPHPLPSESAPRFGIFRLILAAVSVGALYLTSLYSMVLSHTLVEMLSVAIVWSLFALVWNSRRWVKENYLLLLGIALAAAGFIDLMHALAYPDLDVFPGYDANLSAQLWIAARYLLSLSLLVAPLSLGTYRTFRNQRAFEYGAVMTYVALTAGLLALVFLGQFPDCYVEGIGLTPFMIAGEYVICAILLASLGLLWRKRQHLDRTLLLTLMAFTGVTILAELAFSHSVGVSDFPYLSGHILELVAYYLVYWAIVQTGLQRPYELLFRDMEESEQLYHQMFREQAVVKLLIDPLSGAIVEANSAASHFYGYPLDALQKMNIDQISTVPLGKNSPADLAGSAWPRSYFGFQHRLATGDLRDVEVYSVPVQIKGRTLLYSIVYDITERKRAEDALRESEARYRALVEASPDAITLTDMQGRILACNPQTVALHGFDSAQDLQDRNVLDLILPEERARIQYNILQAFHLGSQKKIECTLLRKDGSRFDGELSISTILDVSGRPEAVIGVTRDITGRKQIEDALRKSEAHYRLLEENIVDVIWTMDLKGRFTYVSPSVEKLRGYTPQEVLEQTAEQALTTASLNEMQSAIADLVVKLQQEMIPTEPAYFEMEQPCKDGSTVWTEVLVRSLYDERGELSGFLGVSRDISERKRIEDTQMFLLKCSSQGEDFFQALARYLAECLKMDCVCISRLQPDGLALLPVAFYRDGRFEENTITSLQDTPCGEALGKTICSFPSGVSSIFPQNDALREMGAESYVGATLWSASEQPIGLIAVAGRRPLENHRLAEAILKVVAIRAAGELERRQAELALREQSVEIERFFNSALDLLCIADTEGHFLRLNREWENVLGYSLAEMRGKRFLDFVHPDDLAATRAAIRELIAQKEVLNFTNRYRCRDGSYRWMEWRSIPVGKHIYASGRDVTGRNRIEREMRRLYEQAQQDAAVKAELLDEVNHRVKNNLVHILGIIQMESQRSGDRAADTQTILADLQSRIDGMLTVHSLLSRSQWAPLLLNDLVNQVISGAIAVSPIRDHLIVNMDFSPPMSRDQLIIPNQARTLALILNELTTNTIKHAFAGRERGQIQVEIIIPPAGRPSSMLTLVFQDDGAGWPQDVLSGQREGIGLRLVRGAVQSLPRGSLTLFNNGGAAARITFKLAAIQ